MSKNNYNVSMNTANNTTADGNDFQWQSSPVGMTEILELYTKLTTLAAILPQGK